MREQVRILVRGAYDLQKLRIQMGNRLAGNYRAKLGQAPGEKGEDVLGEDAKEILDVLRRAYGRLTDGLVTLPRQKSFKGDEVISSYTELVLVAQYVDLEKSERDHFNRLGHVLGEIPIYVEFLADVKGIGPSMAGVIVSEIDISASQYPSSLWKYAGLDVAKDGRGRGRYKDHLIDVEYVTKDGEPATRKSITYNPFLKTKLCGVLAPSFLRAGDNCYSRCYNDYKHRLENSEQHQEKSKGHRHAMALRYMVKRFLVDLYVAWRTLEGLPVAEEYSVAKLGLTHKVA